MHLELYHTSAKEKENPRRLHRFCQDEMEKCCPQIKTRCFSTHSLTSCETNLSPASPITSPCLQLSISGSFRWERQMRMALLIYCCCSGGECFTALLLPQVSNSSCSTWIRELKLVWNWSFLFEMYFHTACRIFWWPFGLHASQCTLHSLRTKITLYFRAQNILCLTSWELHTTFG